MIKFFRKIRQNLLSEGKTGKYLKYAIGEIILVMIGILLALQVNNWNESKKQKQKETIILKELRSELQFTIDDEIIPAINYYKKSDSILDRIMKFYNQVDNLPKYIINKSDKHTFEDSLPTHLINMSEWNFVLQIAAFENLKSTGMDLVSNDSLRSKISKIYTDRYPEIRLVSNHNKDFYREQFRPILYDNYQLKHNRTQDNEYFFRTNRSLINRVYQYKLNRKWMVKTLNESLPHIEALIMDIDQELKRIDP